MDTEDNEGGGRTVTLYATDSLERIPASHADLVTAEIRQAFADPIGHFRSVASRCRFPKMKAWLEAATRDGVWALQLHRGDPPEWTSAGFVLFADDVFTAEVATAGPQPPPDLPEALRHYFGLVGQLSWMDFGLSGGLYGATDHDPLSRFLTDLRGDPVPLDETFVWGCSFCGDLLVYTRDGRGGWACHENGQVRLLGSIEESVNWVYNELLENRRPEFDYSWA